MSKLTGKVAVVTGASQGIGEACANAMLGEGATVVVVARDIGKLRAVFAESGSAAIPIAADLLDRDQRLDIVPRILRETGIIDIWVANAGRYVGGNFDENDPEVIEDVLTLNGAGVITPIRQVTPHMITRGEGDIVVIGSIAGRRRPGYEPVYGPVKAEVERFADTLRTQLGRKGVRVGSISPGPTLTPLVESWDAARLAAAKAAGEFMEPEEVADALMYMVTRRRGLTISNLTLTPTAFDKI